MSPSKALVELKNITKCYDSPDGARLSILKGIHLQLKTGESVAIVGPSGSGKSTLLNLIGALDTPTSGQVFLEEKDLTLLSESDLALVRNQKIGFVFQAHHLLPQCTVLENIFLPTLADKNQTKHQENRQWAHQLLEKVGLANRSNHRPGQLSGGECQRVAVARALINRPKLLLADEPTGALDAPTAYQLGKLLLDLNHQEKVALVVVTHSVGLAKQMERLFVLREGQLLPFNS